MKVVISKDERLDYCMEAPFHPPERYPEYPFEDTCEANACYGAVRDLLHRFGMDSEHFGKASWNPLGEVIKPGDNVFLKPNLVSHHNHIGGTEAIITQGPVIRAVLDYVYIALAGRGSITIGDAPYIDTDFDAVIKAVGLDGIKSYYDGHGKINVRVIDLRKERGPIKLGMIKKEDLAGDPAGYAVVDLKKDSEHDSIIKDHEKFTLVFYDRNEMLKHHNREKNEYYISGSVLNADVVINLPKLKTHAKTGISCALKNLVGINGLKGWLPHHRSGSFDKGGDEYMHSDLRKDLFVRLRDEIPTKNNIAYALPLRTLNAIIYLTKYVVPYKDSTHGGSWYGNDTLPRTISDLNKILLYADKKGVMRDTPQRKMFILVDGITAGEKEGPMTNAAKKCGVLVAGHNPVEVDIACSIVMGFDPNKISTIKYSIGAKKYCICDRDPGSIEIISDRCRTLEGVYDMFNCALEPPQGWKGHIEYEKPRSPDLSEDKPSIGHPVHSQKQENNPADHGALAASTIMH